MILYQIDAFTDKVFGGNPAAVCPLKDWLGESLMQQIALENNLAETAFFVKKNERYEIRWFTPTVEVDLCGHATLAAAHALFHHEGYAGNEIAFHSHRSGPLNVSRNGDTLTLDFPADKIESIPIADELLPLFNFQPKEAWRGKSDIMLIFEKESQIKELKPDLHKIAKLSCRGVIATAPGEHVDFVSRFFGPQSGIDEDPVTGSAHTTLTPYWSNRLGKMEMKAMQLSPRIGHLVCRNNGERILISGTAKTYLVGKILVPTLPVADEHHRPGTNRKLR